MRLWAIVGALIVGLLTASSDFRTHGLAAWLATGAVPPRVAGASAPPVLPVAEPPPAQWVSGPPPLPSNDALGMAQALLGVPYAYAITKDELRPGDIMNLTTAQDPRRYGHVRLFAAWANSEQTHMWVYEETPRQSVYHVIAYDASLYAYASHQHRAGWKRRPADRHAHTGTGADVYTSLHPDLDTIATCRGRQCHACGDEDGDGRPHSQPGTDSRCDAHTIANSHPDAVPDGDSDAIANAHVIPDQDAHADANRDSDTYPNTRAHTAAERDTLTDGQSHSYGNGDSNPSPPPSVTPTP